MRMDDGLALVAMIRFSAHKAEGCEGTLGFGLTSNCISRATGVRQICPDLTRAFAIATSFRATAVTMALCGFPAARRRLANLLSSGFWLLASRAA